MVLIQLKTVKVKKQRNQTWHTQFQIRVFKEMRSMDDSPKRSGKVTLELFTVILCTPNFASVLRMMPKIT